MSKKPETPEMHGSAADPAGHADDKQTKRPARTTRSVSAECARRQITEAALDIVRDHGTEALTHAAVAAATGFSKSNVLYHYTTKRDLWQALIERYVEHLDDEFNRALAPFAAKGVIRGRAILPSMILWYRRFTGPESDARWPQVGAQLMALHREDETLTEPIRAWYRRLYDDIAASGLDPLRACGVMLMMDGLFNAGKLGINTFSPEKALALMESALDWVYPPDSAERRMIEAVVRENSADDGTTNEPHTRPPC